MSALATPRLTTLRPGPRRFLSIVCTMLLAACIAAIVAAAQKRRVSARAVLDLGLARRQPAVVETMEVLEDDGAAILVAAEALLDGNAAASRTLLLDAVARRPGSAYGRLLLGRSAPSTGSAAQWERPLELAVSAAPGLDPAAVTLAQRFLAEWSGLPAADRPKGEAALRRAFLNRAFLHGGLIPTVNVLGPEAAVRALPADPEALRAASQILRESGAGPAAELVAARLEALPPAPRASRQRP